jgi:hypothetical protein
MGQPIEPVDDSADFTNGPCTWAICGSPTLKIYEYAPECDVRNAGDVIYARDANAVIFCDGHEWRTVTGQTSWPAYGIASPANMPALGVAIISVAVFFYVIMRAARASRQRR